ncbi:MAG: DUF72 domain-containing protein [Deltaproteobacteria bacterium]|nr:DUF72 domain-containing protein [Deltaproteobacteria bacterium]
MKLWVGTSGYSYEPWLGNFYPEKLAAKDMLSFYASKLSTVEINNTFYRMPKKSVVQSWAEQVGPDFRFVLKAPQRITHMKRLKEAESEVEYFFGVAAALKEKAGVYLFQLPPNLKADLDRLQKFLAVLPSDGNVAFEFRHPSWFCEEVFACLRTRNYALCVSETDDEELRDLVPTANWGYLRLRRTNYQHADLVRWKERIFAQSWDRAYVFFKHEDEGIGPKLAMDLLKFA